jgi:hypothetical protein
MAISVWELTAFLMFGGVKVIISLSQIIIFEYRQVYFPAMNEKILG